MSGYFATEELEEIDRDDLEEHEFEPVDITVEGDGIGPLGPYFERLATEAHRCADVARKARGRGYDPAREPEIPFASDLAARVEALVGPEGVAERIRALSGEMGREELALVVSKEVAAGAFGAFDSKEGALDQAIRTGLAILTEGILVAPLEGVASVKVRPNDDGTEYADIYFAGPIRAAGGTGQAMSVLIADVVRRELGLAAYKATKQEVERFKEEIPAYKRAANLQYTPSHQEIELIVSNLPVGVNGEGTEKDEVSGYRDLPRVETNQLRGGACLVIAEGLTLKAPKILKHVEKLGLEGWGFLHDFVNRKKGEDDGKADGDGTGPKITPETKYINELVAGRPVLSHPSAKGGFRLRYGRARTAGLASTAIHPAIQVLVDDFLAPGTQMKVERPGKGTVVTPCDTIEPPIILLQNGDLVEVHSVAEARELRPKLKRIVDLGEMLVPFGEFLENNKLLPAASWCIEWWRLVVEAAGHEAPQLTDDEAEAAFAFAEETGTPLHPRFTLTWHDLDAAGHARLAGAVGKGRWEAGRLSLPLEDDVKRLLEELGATHQVASYESTRRILVDKRCSLPLVRSTGFVLDGVNLGRTAEPPTGETDALRIASTLAGVALKAKAPCRIGARMGRPEKAAERKMSPPVHTLFPLGGAGGLQRLVKQAAAQGTIGSVANDGPGRYDQIEVGARRCPQCQETMMHLVCKACDEVTTPETKRPEPRVIPLGEMLEDALRRLAEPKVEPGLKGVQGLISEHKLPEPLAKGILRAKHGVFVFKDGTCRYDMTDVPLTHFRPREIGTAVDLLRGLGYTHDMHGAPLERDDQLLELAPQDVVVNEDCLEYLFKVATFTDDLLIRFYGLKPYYNAKEPADLVGQLAVGLAPHTSGGVLCRIIGTTRAQIHFGHPYFHAAKRRNCFEGSTELFVIRGGHAEKTTLADLVEPAMAHGVRPIDAHGTHAVPAPEGLEVLSIDPRTLAPRRIPVTRLIRGRTDAWIDLETSTHRTVRVTPDHDVLVKRDGVLVTVKAAEVRVGDRVPLGLSLPRDPRVPTFDLASLLAGREDIGDVRVRGAEAFFSRLVARIGRKTASELTGAEAHFRETPSRWYRAFPLAHLARLVDHGHLAWSEVPDDARLGIAGDRVALPVRIEATEELCRLLGLYLAEGHARSTPSAHQLSWRNSEPEVLSRIEAAARESFGLTLSEAEDGTKLTLSSRLVHTLVTKVWGAGSRALDKRVPGWCYDLPDTHIAALLAGYFDGDGSATVEPPRLWTYSANRLLLEDVALLCQALGIFGRFVPGRPRPPGKFLKERYEALGSDVPSELGPVHALAFHGSDIKRLAATLPLDHAEKRFRLHELLSSGLEGRLLQAGGRKVDPEERAHCLFDVIVSVEREEVASAPTYCIDVDPGSDALTEKNVLLGNGLYQVRCDGDEDCVMLLLDGLLNFSRSYLPRTRGGQMDAPLTLSIRIDPREIDKEAHNLEVVGSYPLAFFEATEQNASPKEVEGLVETVAARLGGERQYTDLLFTHDSSTIDDGPLLSAYKTIGTMLEKMEGQLGLARKIRAVDEANVASRVICDHFLPDIVGNLKAFSRQTVRCGKCNAKYRRIPMVGRCVKCKNKLTMTVHEASVKKYIEVSKTVAAKYNVDAYTLQRLRLAEEAIDSLFQNDKVKKSTLADFL